MPLPPGVRPSPLDGRLTTSTGTLSLDGLLAGHAGLTLGTSLLIEESGTTDYAGTLLRYFAAEGLVQGHTIHVVGVGEQWARELPGLIGTAGSREEGKRKPKEHDNLKIAWRYEKLGNQGAGPMGSRGGIPSDLTVLNTHARPEPKIIWFPDFVFHAQCLLDCQLIGSASLQLPERSPVTIPSSTRTAGPPDAQSAFCHAFDLTKRLVIPSPSAFNFISSPLLDPQVPLVTLVLRSISEQLQTSPPNTIHRLIIPTMLSPIMYPAHACRPQLLLPFLHGLRGLLRRHASQLSVMLTLPLDLFPRSAGLTRWIELLNDGVMELTPFPHLVHGVSSIASSGAATAQEEQPQGMLKIHRLPVFHERGAGGALGNELGDDLAFTVSRKNFVIKPFSLPPVEGDTDAQHQLGSGEKATAVDVDF